MCLFLFEEKMYERKKKTKRAILIEAKIFSISSST